MWLLPVDLSYFPYCKGSTFFFKDPGRARQYSTWQSVNPDALPFFVSFHLSDSLLHRKGPNYAKENPHFGRHSIHRS